MIIVVVGLRINGYKVDGTDVPAVEHALRVAWHGEAVLVVAKVAANAQETK